jgi:cysteine-rich repeat protein
MRGANRFFGAIIVVGLVLALEACANGSLDDGGSANVVLATQNSPNIPPIASTPAPDGSGCSFTVTAATATLANLPKSELAKAPFSNIVMENVAMTYEWVNPTGSEVTQDVQPVAGLIPVAGTQSVNFIPIRLDYITADLAGRTAGLILVFNGHTVDGHAVQTAPVSGVSLSINSCLTTTVCGDGLISGGETCDDSNQLSGDGCSSACLIETGYICVGQPSVCSPIIP